MYVWYESIFFIFSYVLLYLIVLRREDQLLSSSDLIEFDWHKETKIEGMISITIQLTRYFNLINETNEDLQKRRRKARSTKIFQYFYCDKYKFIYL